MALVAVSLTIAACSDGVSSAGSGAEQVGVFGEATVSVTASGLGPLVVTTSPLAASDEGWAEHTVTVENTSGETVYVNDDRRGQYLGDRELMVTDDGCFCGNVVDGRVEPGCEEEYRPLMIPPGAKAQFPVTLWRALSGMNDLVSDEFLWRKPIRYSDEPFERPSASHGAEGEIVLTYEHLDRVSGDGTSSISGGTKPAGTKPGTVGTPVVSIDDLSVAW